MGYKKRLIILVCSIIIYLLGVNVYNKLNSNVYIEALILNKDIVRGEELKNEYFEKVFIKSDNNDINENLVLAEDIENVICNSSLTKGNILLKKDIILKSQYNKTENNEEIISIKISNPDDMVSYQIEKNSIVNIYYTGKFSLSDSILNDMELPYVTTKTNSINKIGNEYVTVKLVENVKILDIFDKYGNSIDSKNYIKNESNKIDTVMFNIEKDLVLKINNLKNYGEFSISIVG